MLYIVSMNKEFYMKIRNRLKEWRAKKGITQDDLARAIDMSRQSINAIENGKFIPSVLNALKIADFFQTSVEDLFYLEKF